MNTKDLLELASLDAFGLLDEAERRAFEEAFRKAHPSVQEMVRATQRRMADIDAILPDVSPQASLRQRVLEAVALDVERATIPAVAGRIGPDIIPAAGVSRVWRAAAIGCAAAAVVFGFTTLQMQARYGELDNAFRNNAVTEVFAREFGPRFENALMAPRTQFVQFASDTARGAGAPAAVLLLDPETKTGQLFCKDLPTANGFYRLTVLDASGNKTEAEFAFKASGTRVALTDLKNLELKAGQQVVISSSADRAAAAVLRSQSL
ncbi:MAG: hypothetical protein KIT68_01370 [Phycisphaeraceae bacterium]|nr:hypothetical protein [Phycisphaeraceae bacterium]